MSLIGLAVIVGFIFIGLFDHGNISTTTEIVGLVVAIILVVVAELRGRA